jgi:hypothetical protein
LSRLCAPGKRLVLFEVTTTFQLPESHEKSIKEWKQLIGGQEGEEDSQVSGANAKKALDDAGLVIDV